MRLPNAERAFVDMAKLRDYCLSEVHPDGRHKARVFRAALGIGPEDAEKLAASIIEAAGNADATRREDDVHGMRFEFDFRMQKGPKSATIRTAWIVRAGENYPRLASCYVL